MRLVVCVDRDDDLGRKAKVEGPVVGRANVLEAAVRLATADPEDADTNAARDKIRLLDAEWTLLNDPERLRQLADQFLALKTVTPAQFTTMADLDRRLPPVRPPDAPVEPVPEPAVMPPMIAPPVVRQV
jgi:hypothetical protein